MQIPKRYGQIRIDKCPFCDKQATAMSKQDVPVCLSHKEERLDDLKCVCGSSLEMLHGKFGVFFSCIKCGNMNIRKALKFNAVKPRSKGDYSGNPKSKQPSLNMPKQPSDKKEMTVRSDDPRYFD